MERNPAVHQKFLHNSSYLKYFLACIKVNTRFRTIDVSMGFPADCDMSETLLGWNAGPRSAYSAAHPGTAEEKRLAFISELEDMFKDGKSKAEITAALALAGADDYSATSFDRIEQDIRLLHPQFRLDDDLILSFHKTGNGCAEYYELYTNFYLNKKETLQIVRPPISDMPIPSSEERDEEWIAADPRRA